MMFTDLMYIVRPGLNERTRGKNNKGAPQPSWPPAASGGTGHGGTPSVLPLGSPPPEVQCAMCLRSVMQREKVETRDKGRRRVQCKVRATCHETGTPGGRKVKREWEGCLAHCSVKCTPGG